MIYPGVRILQQFLMFIFLPCFCPLFSLTAACFSARNRGIPPLRSGRSRPRDVTLSNPPEIVIHQKNENTYSCLAAVV